MSSPSPHTGEASLNRPQQLALTLEHSSLPAKMLSDEVITALTSAACISFSLVATCCAGDQRRKSRLRVVIVLSALQAQHEANVYNVCKEHQITREFWMFPRWMMFVMQCSSVFLLSVWCVADNYCLCQHFWRGLINGAYNTMLTPQRRNLEYVREFIIGYDTFWVLTRLLEPYITRQDTLFREAIEPPHRVAVALWRLAHGATWLMVEDHLGIGDSAQTTTETAHHSSL